MTTLKAFKILSTMLTGKSLLRDYRIIMYICKNYWNYGENLYHYIRLLLGL